VNSGLLAHQLGQDSEAVDDWQRAVTVDPQQSRAHLYLAEFFDQQGQTQAAARHYRAYLQLAAQPSPASSPGTSLADSGEHLNDGQSQLPIQIKIADADAAGNRVKEAQEEYFVVLQQSQISGDAPLQSLALVHLAELQEKEGQPGEAAKSYQRALALDASLADPRSAAADWLNYGQFLRRHGQPEDLVFACLLRAEELLTTTPGDVLAAVTQARSASETRLGSAAATKIRSNLNPQLQKALSLPTAAFLIEK
jgi:tetratricopeptide (TPR) repeat protein